MATPPLIAPPRLAGAPWLSAAPLQNLFAAFAAAGHDTRAVGGAVRNALLGQTVRDVDLATTALPDAVMRIATAAGFACIPTGLQHGTVTVVCDHQPFEVTTLRRDEDSDGRHARVHYTTDWTEDARRRDFTINALYADADGTIFDPLGGYRDILDRRVRFIGDATARIHEDYLRILRFFRFTAEYAAGKPDPAGFAACVALQRHMDRLSGERLNAEMMKLLSAPGAAATVAGMAPTGLLETILGVSPDVASFVRLTRIETTLGYAPDAVLRLASLVARSDAAAQSVAERLRLSAQDRTRVVDAVCPTAAADPARGEHDAKIALYKLGNSAFAAAVLLAWARSGAPPDDRAWQQRLAFATGTRAPRLPVRGSDVLARGVAAGPAVGRVLDRFEQWWLEAGCPDDRPLIDAKLAEITASDTAS